MRITTRVLVPLIFLLAMLLPSGSASAAPATSERTEDFTFIFTTCTGENVDIQGTQHIVSAVQNDGSTFVQASFQGTGTGSQGNKYILNNSSHFRTPPDAQSARIMLVSKGSAPNQWIIIHFSESGGTTVEVDCRG